MAEPVIFSHLNIIADIAGQYDALLRLYAKMPKCVHTVLVGDMVDRGPKSRQVLEWAKQKSEEGVVTALYGNHEDMLVSFLTGEDRYAKSSWACNGGRATLNSFKTGEGDEANVPTELIEWLSHLPRYFEHPDVLITHAGVSCGDEYSIAQLARHYPEDFIWNRKEPVRRLPYQVFGHNSHWGLKTFSDTHGDFATCIDASRSRVLTGMYWPDRRVYQEPY